MANLILAAGLPAWGVSAFWLVALSVGALILGSYLVSAIRRWRKFAEIEKLTASDQLIHFQELYEDGEITQKEFERIRGALDKQLRSEADLPPASNVETNAAVAPEEKRPLSQ
jgi:hypothetical protein